MVQFYVYSIIIYLIYSEEKKKTSKNAELKAFGGLFICLAFYQTVGGPSIPPKGPSFVL